jgi:hypothetical protein
MIPPRRGATANRRWTLLGGEDGPVRALPKSSGVPPNNGMQLTALCAAADAER